MGQENQISTKGVGAAGLDRMGWIRNFTRSLDVVTVVL